MRRRRRGPDGSRITEVTIGLIQDSIGKGEFDNTMKGRFNLGPQKVRR